MQIEREATLRQFKQGDLNVVVATDVASRGLDIKTLRNVINYDFPQHLEDYIHRIGRTGRAGNKGTATTFFSTSKDARHARKLVEILVKNKQVIPDELMSFASQADQEQYEENSRYHTDIKEANFDREEWDRKKEELAA